MRESLVSVVVPAFNAEAFLERTVRSIRMQTHTNLEIIIVDDGSRDGTSDLVSQVMASDSRVTLISKPNGGVASARNVGLAAAKGDYVAFIDADDLAHPRKIEALVAALQARPECSAAFSLHCNIDEHDRITRFQPGFGTWRNFSLPSHLVLQTVGNASSMLVRRADAVAVGGYDSSYARAGVGGCEDLDFELKLAARGPLVMVPEYLVGYRLYEGNMSSNRPRMARAMLAVVDRCFERFPQLADRVKTFARRTAYAFALSNYRRAMAFRPVLLLMGKFILSDREGAISGVVLPLPGKLLAWMRRPTAPGVSYWDIGEDVGPRSEPPPRRLAHLGWLADDDARWNSRLSVGRSTTSKYAASESTARPSLIVDVKD